VRHRREELGMTRAELADRAGIKELAVACIEEQPLNMSTETLPWLAYALDLPDSALLGSDTDMPSGFKYAPGG
jgi:transcriptional regulator with XRE-family HTH domain